MALIAITNPSDGSAEARIVEEIGASTPYHILERFGHKLENGAQVVIIKGDRVWQYLVTRMPDDKDRIDLRSGLGVIIATRSQRLMPDAALETFTVFGKNDGGENFTAVVWATENTVHDVGVSAGLIFAGREEDVDIYLIVKGDATGLGLGVHLDLVLVTGYVTPSPMTH